MAHKGRAVLLLGASGSGKSSLSLQLMALGAELVSDDRVVMSLVDGTLIAQAPAAISGLIEARGVGLLRAHPHGPAPVYLAVDLDREENDRLPQVREFRLLGHAVPLLGRVSYPHFPAAILQMLASGRHTP